MPNNNDIFLKENQNWWGQGDDNPYAFLRYAVNPVRFTYFNRIIREKCFKEDVPQTLLDVGCGGGFLSEEFAKIGFDVTGIDPSPVLLKAAREHAAENSLVIKYLDGYGENLPLADNCFDFVACCDVFEHVNDPESVICEISRVMKPGGVFFYDTINRTFKSYLAAIKIAQEWKFTAWEQPGSHAWNKFVKPERLIEIMRNNGLINQELKGISPGKNPAAALLIIIKRVQGKISRYEMGQRLKLQESKDTSVQYMGFAQKV
jgi:2-polyprenyl-6-hydroxyphenyl methylase/3-demethylubiquinone-9 3-methyltransferase